MITIDELKNALFEAGNAHGEFETNYLKGVYDEDWPSWYAAFVIGKLKTFTTPSKLAILLKEAQKEHESSESKESWQSFYSEYIINKI